MKKRIIQKTFTPTEDMKFIISRKTDIDKKDNFPFSFFNEYEIISGGRDDTIVDPRDTFNNCDYYREISSGDIPGLDKSLFPELNLEGTKSYLTNTGIVVIFANNNIIIYDILLGDNDDFYSITTSSINNFFNTNDNNPKNHKYIAIKVKKGEENVYAILDKMVTYKGGNDFYHYFYSDMDLLDCDSFDERDISSDYERDSSISNDLFIERTENSSFNKYSAIVRLAKRQMFVIQSNFSHLEFYVNVTDIDTNEVNTIKVNPLERVNSEIELTLYNAMPEANSGIHQYIIDISEESGSVLNDGKPYIDFIIKYTNATEKDLEGWLEVF